MKKQCYWLAALLFTSLATQSANAAICSYKIDNEWSTGFIASITITNNDTTAINGWNIGWRYNNNRMTSGWNAMFGGNNPYTAQNLSYNGAIQPGRSISFGFQGDKNGAAAEIPTITGNVCNTAQNSSASSQRSSLQQSSSLSSSSSSQPVTTWTFCATENETCRFSGTKRVRYGAQNNWNEGNYTNSVVCNNATFGDPLPRTRKTCEIADVVNGTDTTSPTPPSNLRITALTCNSLTLWWNAASDNTGVDSYDIYHDGQHMKNIPGNQLSTSLTLTPGANWGFYVNAVDAAGNVSQASETLTVQIPQCEVDNIAPTAPANLRGTITGTTANLEWIAATDNIRVTAYDIFRNTVKVGSTTGLTYIDSGLTANNSYEYTVVARDAQNNVSPHSNLLILRTSSNCTTAICQVDTVAPDNDIPWGLLALPDGNVLYSRRDAHDIIRLNTTTGVKTTVGAIPNVQSTDGEGGLLGIAVTPDFPGTDNWLYIYHTSPTDNRVVRIQYRNNILDISTLEIVLAGIGRNKYHNGGRLRFGPDGKLYVATGDAQRAENAQNINNLDGKILRMNPDGSIPADNPFNNYVWSYGHRNPQGLAFDSQGRLWQQEFGNSIMDETNLVVRGGNYGWPNCEGTASLAGSGCNTAGYIAPKYTTTTAAGSCSGIAIVNDALYIACLRGTRLYRAEIDGNELRNVQQFFNGTYGRLRTVEPSIDGNLWLTTSKTGDKDSIPNNSNESILKVNLGN